MQNELVKIVNENFKQVFFDKENQGINLPYHLQREFKKFLYCGNPAYGMARFACVCCSQDRFVSFSCKGRTLCPRCTGRRMSDTAKHLVENVIPDVPIRQWVLSMPYSQRFLLATRPLFLRKVLAIYHRVISNFYQSKFPNSRVGAITVVQRFGGALNLNVHFHSLFTDGVFDNEQFREIIPTHEDIVKINQKLKLRINKALKRELENDPINFENYDTHAFSVQNKDEKSMRPKALGKIIENDFSEFRGSRISYEDGYSLHTRVKIPAFNRYGLEHLCRYVLRGPLSKERITYTKNKKVILKLKTPYSDGTTHLEFTSEQFIKRMIALIPPPRQNLIRYIGVFGARYKNREKIVSRAKPKELKVKKRTYRTHWGDLLKYVFKQDLASCKRCGGQLKYISSIVSTYECRKILDHLKIEYFLVEPTRPRPPPEVEFFDQSEFKYEY